MSNERIILGIDPGTNIMGYGLIKQQDKKIECIAVGILKLDKLPNQAMKLRRIFERVLSLIDEFHPDELAIEAPFFGKNVQSMLKLGRAQGVAIAAALYRDIPMTEYSPRRIKQSITGSGSASKEQVAAMIQRLVKLSETPETLDATDALAVAICHYLQRAKPDSNSSGSNSWSAFVKNNASRVSG